MSIVDKKTKVNDGLAALRARPAAQQQAAGYADTLREVLQQPATWRGTAALLREPAVRERLARALSPRPSHIVLTGSGSSMYIGECLAPTLQEGLGIPAQAIAAGTLLTHWRGVLPPGEGLLVSLARSGDSPESCGVVDRVLADAPAWRHLVITCNANGKLATRYNHDPRVTVLVLDERTNDRSLVMTSSFTNLLVAGSGLLLDSADVLTEHAVAALAAVVEHLFDAQADALAELASRNVEAAVYLGSGGGIGAAHEAALKMVEMTGGKVITMAETFLGLRHGPMSSIRPTTLIVGLLSADPAVRGYELDLLRELDRKQLGLAKLVVGEGIPADVLRPGDVAIELAGLGHHGELPSLLAGVVAGQLLAFFRCLHLGERPDAPSQGVLTRVVQAFTLHGADA
jgi:tagatose-6-phosphate ketose/aldose isomerase